MPITYVAASMGTNGAFGDSSQATTESQIWINNCLQTTQRGVRGNGINYFKNGVYHCENDAVCRARFKNVKLYQKL